MWLPSGERWALLTCPRCQTENPPLAKFCLECAAPLPMRCARCGSQLPAAAKFCPECAQAVSAEIAPKPRFTSPQSYTPRHLAEKILTSKAAIEGERKLVTVLFCDLVNSTSLAERIGAEAMHTLLNQFFEVALAAVHRYEGTINQFLGDGFMALFGAPIAHEDHARRAVLAALGVQGEFGGTAPRLTDPSGTPLAIRIGLNTGLVVVGAIGDNLRMDYTAVGDTTNLAARLEQAAQPGAILLSEATKRLLKGEVQLEALGPLQVKGKDEAVEAYRVLGLVPHPAPSELRVGPRLSRFVGREREVSALRDLLDQVERGQCQVVGLVGEPGVGKSRLLYEFWQALLSQQVRYLEGHCVSYGSGVPYLPLVEVLRNSCALADQDPPEVLTEKLRIRLKEIGMRPDEWEPYLLRLLGVKADVKHLDALSPEVMKARTFEALHELNLRASQRQPVILAFEDLHWIDKTSEECLVSLVDSLPGSRILLMATYRPGYRPPWFDKSYVTQLALRPLARRDSLSIVRAGDQTLPDLVTNMILENADGNPFFLEELTRDATEREGSYQSLSVPDTIQGVLMARIDRLPEGTKRLLQTASVLGRWFPLRLLAAVSDGAAPIDRDLAVLRQLEFLHPQPAAEEPTFLFKHALTQEVAYQSLLNVQRKTLHLAAGRALEALYADRLEKVYDLLAHHYSRSDEAAKAVEYLTRLARLAARGYAHAEAVTAFQEALVQADRLQPEDRDGCLLDIVPRLARSLSFLGRLEEALDLLIRQRDRVSALQNPFVTGRYCLLLAHTYTFLGDRQRAAENAHQAMVEARISGDDATMGKAAYVLAMESMWCGQFEQGVEHGREAVRLLERVGEQAWLGSAHWIVGANCAFLGEFDAGLEALARAQEIGDALRDPRVQTPAAWTIGLIHMGKREWQEAISACERALHLSPDPRNTADAVGHLGTAYLEMGDPARAIPLLEQSVQQWNQFRGHPDEGWFTTWLSEAYLLNGQVDKARELALHGLKLVTDQRYVPALGLAQRALGRLAQAEGNLLQAETHLKEALATFESIHARYLAGRTQLDLAAVAQAQGNLSASGTHLQKAHALFTRLQVPEYVERTEQLATKFGIILANGPVR
jgi:class 3 adenylate cyclase/tetratricopeptide (TPR) repeat protein